MMNKLIKITCSFLLLLSLFNISVFHVYADDEDTTEGTSEVIENASDTGSDAPEEISVQVLEEETEAAVMSNEVIATDRVSYVDVNGNAIEGAPTSIKIGNISDHKDLNIDGRHFDFISAKVGDLNCAYIGVYDSTVYYSTDGIIAIRMENNQKLVMTYQEYYIISFKEDIPDGGVAGTITTSAGTVDTSQTLRVNVGEELDFTVTPAHVNQIRYKISSITSDNNTVITKESGDEYGASYTAVIESDDVINIKYGSDGAFRVNVKEINNEGITCITTDKDHYTGTYINDFTFSESDLEGIDKNTITLPVFHVISTKRIVSLQLNGFTLRDDTTRREVPYEVNNPLTVRATTASKNTFSVQISLVHLSGSSESECNYGYQLTVKLISGEWEDLNFVPTYGERRTQTLTLKVLTETNGHMIHNDAGATVAVYNYLEEKTGGLEVVHDNDVFSMDETQLLRKQVKFIFAKANPGYSISIGGERTLGTQDTNPTYAQSGTIDKLNANTLGGKLYTNFNNNWEKAKEAAEAAGYTHFLVMTGESGDDGAVSGLEWDLYVAQIMATGGNYYVMYDKGNLPDSSVVSDMPTEADMTTSSRQVSGNQFTNAPVYGPRSLGTTFKVGENSNGPACDGYIFTGWKLVDKNSNEGDIYQNGSSFTITSDNVSYSNNDFCIDNSAGALNSYSNCSYRFVAQWKKIESRTVKVNHYLKVPDGNVVLGKTTEGTITFGTDNETVTAIANPEPAGTFSGYIFDNDDSHNLFEKTVTNDGTADTIELNLYYKPTVLTVSKTVTGYNLEPDKEFTFTISSASSMKDNQIYIKKADTTEFLTFTDNKATFTLKKDESVEISCLSIETTYTVTETDPGTNFKAFYQIDSGNKTEGNEASFTIPVTGIKAIEFINTSTISPPVTGIRENCSDILSLTFIPVCITVILAGLYCIRKFR